MKIFFATLITPLFPYLAMAQGTITIGTNNAQDFIPFGVVNGGAAYVGEYQQIYDGSAFSNPVLISKIAFSEVDPGSLAATYNLSIGLGNTTRTPASPGTDFATGFTTLFSGSLSAVFTPAANDFDLVIPFSTAFYYNPTQGNLLLDVTVSSATGDNVDFALDQIPSMGRLMLNTSGSSVVSKPDWGLVTQFTIPEPPAFAYILFGGGILLCARVAFNRRRKSNRVART
jgi:hypothetical protein